MSKLAKVGIALGGTLVFLLVSLSILVKVMITPEKVREHLLPLVSETLNRNIEVSEIDIGIFSGVSLVGLQVKNIDGNDDFISVQSMGLHYKLLALLTGDLVIDQILLDQPRIVVSRNADGQFNFDDLLAAETESAATQDTTKNSEESQTTPSSPFNLLVNEVSITGGEILFIDRAQNSKSPYRYTLDQFNFQASKITLDRSFPIKLVAELNGSKVEVSGHYDIANQSGDLDLQLSSLDLQPFAPYYRQSIPGKLGSAALTINLEVQLQPEEIESKGKVLLEGLDLVLNDLPEAELKNAKVGVDYALNFDLSKQKLDLSTFILNFNDTILGVEGAVELGGAEPTLALALLFDKLDLRALLQGLPAGLTQSVQAYSLAGQVDGRVDFAGKPSSGAKLVKSAKIDLINVQATVDSLRAGVNGNITYADQQVAADKLLLNFADQQAELKFKAENLLGKIIKGEFHVSAATLDLNSLLPVEAETKTKTSAKKTSGSQLPPAERQPTVADEIGPFDLPLDMTGTLKVGKLIYKQLNLDQVSADLVLKDNHLKINQLRSGIAGGEFLASTDVNLGVKGLAYQGQMKLDQSQLVSLISGVLPQAKQSVTGLLQWQNNFSGRGTLPDNLLKALQIKGAMQLNKGKITGSPLLEQLSVFLSIPELKILSFETLESNYDLRDGMANLSGQLNSSKAKLKPEGTIGVDGSLNMKLDARLAPDLMRSLGAKTGLQQTLSDKDGWGILPLTIKGSITSPKIGFDAKALQAQATDKFKDEAASRLLEKIAPGGGDNTPVKQLLDNTLNKLFGN